MNVVKYCGELTIKSQREDMFEDNKTSLSDRCCKNLLSPGDCVRNFDRTSNIPWRRRSTGPSNIRIRIDRRLRFGFKILLIKMSEEIWNQVHSCFVYYQIDLHNRKFSIVKFYSRGNLWSCPYIDIWIGWKAVICFA